MAVAFSGTLRALQADRLPWKLAGLTSLLVLPAALAWMTFAEITLYEVSSSARLEVQGAPSSVATEVEGRVVLTNLQVGLQTAPGDILMVLDGEAVQRAMEERRQHITALRSRRTALSVEIEAAVQALESLAKARGLAFQEAEAQLVAAVARSQYARQSLERSLILSRQKAVAEDELEKKRAEADSAAALVQAAQLTITRGEQDRLADEKQRQAELARLRREAVELDGDAAVDEAMIKRLEYDLERRTVRANVAGRVEEVVPIRVGAVARPGEKLGTIVPPGDPRIIAFVPVVAVGRIHPGQSARLRLDGFPWTQYGTLAATVSGVGSEASQGTIRVDLAVKSDRDSRIPLQHGQTGIVEIAVERTSPAILFLRAAGEYLMTHRPAAGS